MPSAPPALPLSQKEIAAGWSVDDVADWLVSMNASVLANVFRGNAVNGADLLELSWPRALAADLNLSNFAAQKLLELREKLLGGPM